MGAPRSLLVIEDNDGDVFLIKRALQEHNVQAEVTVCRDGESAIRLLNSPQMESPPDAIIIDLCLPQIEGLDLAQDSAPPRLCRHAHHGFHVFTVSIR